MEQQFTRRDFSYMEIKKKPIKPFYEDGSIDADKVLVSDPEVLWITMGICLDLFREFDVKLAQRL